MACGCGATGANLQPAAPCSAPEAGGGSEPRSRLRAEEGVARLQVTRGRGSAKAGCQGRAAQTAPAVCAATPRSSNSHVGVAFVAFPASSLHPSPQVPPSLARACRVAFLCGLAVTGSLLLSRCETANMICYIFHSCLFLFDFLYEVLLNLLQDE